jgi:hypothetical protein
MSKKILRSQEGIIIVFVAMIMPDSRFPMVRSFANWNLVVLPRQEK